MADTTKGASAPAFSIRVEGRDVPPDASANVIEVVVEESLDAASAFTIELSNWDMDKQQVTWSDSDLFAPGAAVEIDLGHDGSAATVIKGEVVRLELALGKALRSSLVVRGYDRLHRFRRGRRTQSYLQVKDSDVATQIAQKLGLQASVEDSGEVHAYLLQLNQSDVDFLLSRARASGFELLMDEKTLHFRKPRSGAGKTATISATTTLVSATATLSAADQLGAVSVRGWDPKAKQALVGKAAPGDLNGTMGGKKTGPEAGDAAFGAATVTVVERPVATQNEADLLAHGLLNELALEYVRAEATVVGDPTLHAGDVVELDGLGTRFSGLYYLTRVRHVLHDGYLTHLEARRVAA